LISFQKNIHHKNRSIGWIENIEMHVILSRWHHDALKKTGAAPYLFSLIYRKW
jgi:hypothetical protein